MAKPCGFCDSFAIEFNSLGTPPSHVAAPHAGVDDGVAGAACCAWTGGGDEVVVGNTVPPLDGLLCCARCPHHGGPLLCCGVERAGPNAGALVQAAVRPGAVLRLLRARPSEAAHICAQSPGHGALTLT